MGDSARHRTFAAFIADRWPDPTTRVADVAGGHGQLNAELYRLGHRNVVTFDKRRNRWGRAHYEYGTFGPHVSRRFDLVVAMHPDDATDVAMDWAIRRGVPFAVVPCCIRPQAWTAPDGCDSQDAWIEHLAECGKRGGYQIERRALPIKGANRMLVGSPVPRPTEGTA